MHNAPGKINEKSLRNIFISNQAKSRRIKMRNSIENKEWHPGMVSAYSR